MRNYNTIFYFLFILLVMGAFAAMAQNGYGLKMMGGVAMVFALIFLIRLITVIRKKRKKDFYVYIEPACLFILSVVLSFRIFYIYFSSIEIIFVVTAVVLSLIYLLRMISRVRYLQPRNSLLAWIIMDFHLSIILFLLSLAIIPYSFKLAESIGAVSFILMVLFIIAGLVKKNFLVEGNAVTAFWQIRLFKDYSGIIVTVLLMFSFYAGLNKIGLLPEVYSDEYPRAYFELVNRASSAEDANTTDTRRKSEEFIKEYQQFIKDNDVK